MDYSLLLGVIDLEGKENKMAEMKSLEEKGLLFFSLKKERAFMIGIIDYFQKYTLLKLLEKWKKKITMFSPNLDTSSQSSGFYAKRFMTFQNQIFRY